MKPLAIILINWNSFQLSKETLDSLFKADGEFDVILVDNGSASNEGEQLKNLFPSLILIQSPTNKGFTGGNNMGLQYALLQGYKYVMMLNNDVEVDPHFLIPLLNRLEANPQIGAIQPLIYFYHDRKLIWNAGGEYLKTIGVSKTLHYRSSNAANLVARKIDWITGCAFLIRTDVLKKTGLLEEKFFIYHEDVDLSLRIQDAGFELWLEPESVIYHIAGMAHKAKQKGREGYIGAKVHFLNARNTIWILKKYTKTIFWPTVFMYHLFYSISISLYFIARARFSKLKAWWQGIAKGIAYSI